MAIINLNLILEFYEKVIGLRSHGVRVLLGLGGWNDSAGDKYSRLVNNASARRKFIVHALDFIEQFGFDGLDLDWEYPRCWQVRFCECILHVTIFLKFVIKDNQYSCYCDQNSIYSGGLRKRTKLRQNRIHQPGERAAYCI